MTSLTELDPYTGGGDEADRLPSFVFKRITRKVKGVEIPGDGVKGRIMRSQMVDVTRGAKTTKKLVVEVELVEESRGGIVEKATDEDGNEVTRFKNFASGDCVTIWVGPGAGMEAVSTAVREAGATEIQDGAVLEYWLDAHKDTGKENPLNLFAATYEPVIRSTSLDELE